MHNSLPHEIHEIITGPAGDLEILMQEAEMPTQTTAIICHPHPLHGGTMYNKVVTTIAKTLHELGLRTVRFNFRGVGKSEGVHDEGRGEVEDTLAVAQWIKKLRPHDQLWLAGFSFGGFIAAVAASRLPVKQLISLAPQASRFAEVNLPPLSCPWLIVQGENDEIVDPESVYAWVETVTPPPTLIRLPHTGHFFHGKLNELRRALVGNLPYIRPLKRE